jgi:hypothetical protein
MYLLGYLINSLNMLSVEKLVEYNWSANLFPTFSKPKLGFCSQVQIIHQLKAVVPKPGFLAHIVRFQHAVDSIMVYVFPSHSR